jgi:hypothetical protein
MDIHHGLDGNRRVVVERPDHSRVFAERGGRGYVQHPYMYHGHEYAQRTYWDHGHAYARYYGRYPYHGVYLEVYAPVRFYPVGFYGWAYNPWVTPVPYAWGWGGNPWYGYYGFYFNPYPVYAGPAFWLTDYLIATSLQAAYAAQAQANANAAAAAAAGPVLTPDVKAQIAEEVKYDVQQENLAAQANSGNSQAAPADTGVAALMSDGRPHVFVAGTDLDLVDASGRECMVTQGDVVQVQSAPGPDAVQVNAIVLASKGGNECALASTVTVALTDLQDMQNHMRETIDQGMADLQAKQGKAGLPAAPAADRGPPVDASFAQGAPPPDANAQAEITAQASAADAAEKEDASAAVAAGSPGAGPSGPPPTISLGEPMDQVTAAIGQPTRIVDLGAKNGHEDYLSERKGKRRPIVVVLSGSSDLSRRRSAAGPHQRENGNSVLFPQLKVALQFPSSLTAMDKKSAGCQGGSGNRAYPEFIVCRRNRLLHGEHGRRPLHQEECAAPSVA